MFRIRFRKVDASRLEPLPGTLGQYGGGWCLGDNGSWRHGGGGGVGGGDSGDDSDEGGEKEDVSCWLRTEHAGAVECIGSLFITVLQYVQKVFKYLLFRHVVIIIIILLRNIPPPPDNPKAPLGASGN